MNVTRRMIVIPVATVMAAGIGAGAFAVGLIAARDVPEAVTADTTFIVSMDGQQEFSAGGVAGAGDLDGFGDAQITIDTATDEVCVDVTFTDVDDRSLDAHPPRCGRRQRTDRRGLRSHPGPGTVRHLRDVTSASPTRSRRTRSASTSTPTRHRSRPARSGASSSHGVSPTCCRHRFGSMTPGCRTRSAPRRSSRTRPPSST